MTDRTLKLCLQKLKYRAENMFDLKNNKLSYKAYMQGAEEAL